MGFFKNLFTQEEEVIRKKGDNIELIRIKETAFTLDIQKAVIPKSEAKLLNIIKPELIE